MIYALRRHPTLALGLVIAFSLTGAAAQAGGSASPIAPQQLGTAPAAPPAATILPNLGKPNNLPGNLSNKATVVPTPTRATAPIPTPHPSSAPIPRPTPGVGMSPTPTQFGAGPVPKAPGAGSR